MPRVFCWFIRSLLQEIRVWYHLLLLTLIRILTHYFFSRLRKHVKPRTAVGFSFIFLKTLKTEREKKWNSPSSKNKENGTSRYHSGENKGIMSPRYPHRGDLKMKNGFTVMDLSTEALKMALWEVLIEIGGRREETSPSFSLAGEGRGGKTRWK